MNTEIVTRFAPSPTGFLHVGGARTALFNYLLARKTGGRFLLRIEDTDKERSREELTRQIFAGLKWLGLEWDGPVVHQGANSRRHAEMANELLVQKKAYRCFCTREELENRRARAGAKDPRAYLYDGSCRNLSEAEIQRKLSQELEFTIRFKTAPGNTGWEDGVHGEVSVDNREIGDFIILRSDGSPVYQLAVVVDDYDMGITHVLRGDDHLSNTPKQLLIYQAMGWASPDFTHVPLILGTDKKRLSKRHGATSVEEYRNLGILPEALFNYLAFLGWSPGDEREIMDRQEIIESFSVAGISKKSAVFDMDKLLWMNGPYLSRKRATELYPAVLQEWEKAGLVKTGETDNPSPTHLRIIDLLKTRAHSLAEFSESADYFFRHPANYDEKGLKKHLKSEQIWELLAILQQQLKALAEFNQQSIEESIRSCAAENDVAAAKLIHPLRLALTGRTASPGLFELMEILGPKVVAERIALLLAGKDRIFPSTHLQQE